VNLIWVHKVFGLVRGSFHPPRQVLPRCASVFTVFLFDRFEVHHSVQVTYSDAVKYCAQFRKFLQPLSVIDDT